MDCKIVNAKNVMEANHEDQGYIIKDGIIVLCKARAELRPCGCRCVRALHVHCGYRGAPAERSSSFTFAGRNHRRRYRHLSGAAAAGVAGHLGFLFPDYL